VISVTKKGRNYGERMISDFRDWAQVVSLELKEMSLYEVENIKDGWHNQFFWRNKTMKIVVKKSLSFAK
jgi:hypothetical protein